MNNLRAKRWFIHYFDKSTKTWKKIYKMCLTKHEASYNMNLLEKSSKLKGEDTFYRVIGIWCNINTIKQLELH